MPKYRIEYDCDDYDLIDSDDMIGKPMKKFKMAPGKEKKEKDLSRNFQRDIKENQQSSFIGK